MSVEASIVTRAVAFTGLNALISGRIYADVAEPDTAVPYVVFREISDVFWHAMGNTPTTEYRYQFDCYAVTKAGALALKDQVAAAFNFYIGGAITSSLLDAGSGGIDALDTNAQLYRSTRDFKITE